MAFVLLLHVILVLPIYALNNSHVDEGKSPSTVENGLTKLGILKNLRPVSVDLASNFFTMP